MTVPIKPLQILQTLSIADLMREEIAGLIKRGDVVAGDRLNELSFAQRFNVGRAPIREAFRALAETGLVKVEKNRGVFVREIHEPEARELCQLRSALDDMAGRLLAPRVTEEMLEELNSRLARLKDAARAGDMAAYFPLNIGFHDRIVEFAENAVLPEFYRKVIDRMHLLRRRNFDERHGSAQSQIEHRDIVAALATRDPDIAAVAMRKHVLNGYARLTDSLMQSLSDDSYRGLPQKNGGSRATVRGTKAPKGSRIRAHLRHRQQSTCAWRRNGFAGHYRRGWNAVRRIRLFGWSIRCGPFRQCRFGLRTRITL